MRPTKRQECAHFVHTRDHQRSAFVACHAGTDRRPWSTHGHPVPSANQRVLDDEAALPAMSLKDDPLTHAGNYLATETATGSSEIELIIPGKKPPEMPPGERDALMRAVENLLDIEGVTISTATDNGTENRT